MPMKNGELITVWDILANIYIAIALIFKCVIINIVEGFSENLWAIIAS